MDRSQADAPRAVFCFDRDLTVSTNPPDDTYSVPLSWLKYLTHERTDCDSWASGNQHLRKEGAVPGMAEAKQVWNALVPERKLPYPSVAVEGDPYKPSRRDGLRLVKDIYERAFPDSAIAFIVVDDVDLSDLNGFQHYYPETFVYAVVSERIFGFTGSLPVSDIPVNADDCPESYEMSLQSLRTVLPNEFECETMND